MDSLSETQQKIINEYCTNNMKKLRSLCSMIWGNKNIPEMEYDDLLSNAQMVLWKSVKTYDSSMAKFETYLIHNLRNEFRMWYRDTYLRAKRKNLQLDAKGKIVRDDNGYPIVIYDICIDDVDEDSCGSCGLISEDEQECNLKAYISVLSPKQKIIVDMLLEDYTLQDIRKYLHISQKKFNRIYEDMKSFEKTILLRRF